MEEIITIENFYEFCKYNGWDGNLNFDIRERNDVYTGIRLTVVVCTRMPNGKLKYASYSHLLTHTEDDTRNASDIYEALRQEVLCGQYKVNKTIMETARLDELRIKEPMAYSLERSEMEYIKSRIYDSNLITKEIQKGSMQIGGTYGIQ